MELGLALARLIELTEARNVAAWAHEHIEAGGGVASFAGPSSPISHAIGVGMNGPVTESDIDSIEQFYRSRGAPANMDLCPLADPSLMETLGRRGYRITEFQNVLVSNVLACDPPPGVRIAGPDEAGLWTRTMLAGFFEKTEFTAEELTLGDGIFSMPSAAAFLATSEGAPAAAGAACLRGGVAYLFGDSTLPLFRKRGLHSALIRARMAWAAAGESTLAAACTVPGSGSQRNYLRAGFAVAYTKMNMCRDW